ncbi:hypothetical protein BCV53_03990 [Parageobacillus thermoglucosidasius]|uniref:Uncharacterized protein n=1 Tax=Parageobacillus thermoglucosidasius TaxID=1426 RepID=A0AAN1D5M8_PARTM|nr:hypothetical protein AOT13_03975 [Parageobacillus thermoglucosidasius]ANZ29339.1 hypothetical protein BCV53_03990 [Parageobacillus thermoglucosidasius]APM80077.1 hypothetical protein BCV54_03995 [Parageobacillus thermoglucosidasius]KJX69913.1 hypothetical protein WH82_03730 [Parageobacillus thermoglucosidasius]OUM88952.1 MAG: hypothetical protein BAA00_16805 [Parageobacillus thermoglucosidasius]
MLVYSSNKFERQDKKRKKPLETLKFGIGRVSAAPNKPNIKRHAVTEKCLLLKLVQLEVLYLCHFHTLSMISVPANVPLSSQVLHKFFARKRQGAPGRPGGGRYRINH